MKNHYRAIWISDLHIGTKGFQAERLLHFLKHNSCEILYLVGDIIDMWALSRKVYFPQAHVNVLKKILSLSKKQKVIYVRGNHDEALEHFIPFNIGNIEVVYDTLHRSIEGKEIFVTHGDKYDQVMKYAKWLAWLGDIGYTFLLNSNRYVNWFRKHMGLGYWSLSAYAKRKVKSAVNFIGDFETTVAQDIRNNGFDGVICGHIHHAEIKDIDGVIYMNDGDWVESCTALVETKDGEFKIVEWLEEPDQVIID